VTDQVRVALLARAGQAREQLHRALEEAGALIVAEGDPAELDPKDVSEKLPKVFLVSLEPATDKAIERFDRMFELEGVELMFYDSEVTAKLDGWDLNRWARHLASKLLGRETLPPVPAGAPAIGEAVDEAHDAGALLQPGLPTTPAEEMDGAKLEDYTGDSEELAEWVPSSPSLTEAAAAAPAAGEEFSLDTDLGIDLDLAALEAAVTAPPRAAAPEPEPAVAEGDISFPDLPEGVRFSTFESDAAGGEELGDIDADVAALAAQLEAFEKSDTRGQAAEPEFSRPTDTEADAALNAPAVMPKAARPADKAKPAAEAPAAKAKPIDFGNLSLSPVDELEKAPPIEVKFAPPSEPVAKKSSFGELSLEGEVTPAAAPAKPAAAKAASAKPAGPGAVVVLAGLGGPDAVRQLLSSLPDTLAVPVLLYQHLEVGKHERLVEQLSKISKLPVSLAKEGDLPQAGHVSLLPAGMTAQGEGLRFSPGNLSQLIGALPPAGSMVIVLSGADATLVPMILAVKDGGGTVLAQDPDVCFDAAAAEAMRKEGAQVFPALGLARQVAARWP
jgi:chemotaxis response regulator CheB